MLRHAVLWRAPLRSALVLLRGGGALSLRLVLREVAVEPEGERELPPQSAHDARDGALFLLPACLPRAWLADLCLWLKK